LAAPILKQYVTIWNYSKNRLLNEEDK